MLSGHRARAVFTCPALTAPLREDGHKVREATRGPRTAPLPLPVPATPRRGPPAARRVSVRAGGRRGRPWRTGARYPPRPGRTSLPAALRPAAPSRCGSAGAAPPAAAAPAPLRGDASVCYSPARCTPAAPGPLPLAAPLQLLPARGGRGGARARAGSRVRAPAPPGLPF